jgi:L-amino acid N-acyltransferase YncA
VGVDNASSIHLFLKKGFEQTGLKKDWQLHEGSFRDVIFFQKIKT